MGRAQSEEGRREWREGTGGRRGLLAKNPKSCLSSRPRASLHLFLALYHGANKAGLPEPMNTFIP